MDERESPDRRPSLPTQQVLGIPIHSVRIGEALEYCREASASRTPLMVGVVNAAKIVKMQSDELLSDSVLNSDLIIADGMAVVWASRILGAGLPERVTGIGLFEGLLAVAEQDGRSVYFLGAEQGTLEELIVRVKAKHPDLRIAGSRNGYFSEEDEPELAAEIAELAPDFLFVGITTPKKEIFLDRWGKQMGDLVCHGVGGSFDVYAGKTKRAPILWQRMGIEWAYRIVQEPRRMWRRYWVTNTAFIAMVLSDWIRARFS